ncbi:MAG TPA: GntR family transcriptional regulator [Longimicrobiaceae bacterium]|nr:GntR family transcriptional regulator [Longimicrobiaceae bacterium]
MFSIDPTDPTPVETQIARTVRSAVQAGVLGPGEALPTVRRVAVELRVSANTVERAFRELVRDGVLIVRPGAGYFVATTETATRDAAYHRLTTLEDSFLRAAGELGFSLDEIIIHLDSRRQR